MACPTSGIGRLPEAWSRVGSDAHGGPPDWGPLQSPNRAHGEFALRRPPDNP